MTGESGERAKGSGAARSPSVARSDRSDRSKPSDRSAGDCSEASAGGGRERGTGRKVVIPMPWREDFGTAQLDHPLARVTLAARQPQPAWQQKVARSPARWEKHVSAVLELVVEAQGVQRDLRIPFPCALLVKGSSNLPEGQAIVGMFAYRLVSEH